MTKGRRCSRLFRTNCQEFAGIGIVIDRVITGPHFEWVRNYVKLLAMTWTVSGAAGPHPPNPISTSRLYAFGTDEVELAEIADEKEAVYRALFPVEFSVARSEPQICWWLLDHLNIALILNGPHNEIAQYFWATSDLPDPGNIRFTDIDWGRDGLDIVRVKGVGDESPRKDWSHDH